MPLCTERKGYIDPYKPGGGAPLGPPGQNHCGDYPQDNLTLNRELSAHYLPASLEVKDSLTRVSGALNAVRGILGAFSGDFFSRPILWFFPIRGQLRDRPPRPVHLNLHTLKGSSSDSDSAGSVCFHRIHRHYYMFHILLTCS